MTDTTFPAWRAFPDVTELTAHHVGTTVTDLDRAVEFYRDALGFAVLDRFTVSGDSFAAGVGVPDATGRFAHLDGGGVLASDASQSSSDSSDGVRVELVEYDPAGEAGDGPDSVNDPGAKHMGFAVDDVDAVYESLPDDVETLSEPQTTSSGARILFVRDPEDNLIEIISP